MVSNANTANVRILLLVVCVVTLMILTFYLINQQEKLDCNKCVVTFKTKSIQELYSEEIIGEELYSFDVKVNVSDLIEQFDNNKCLVTWEENGGYRFNGK